MATRRSSRAASQASPAPLPRRGAADSPSGPAQAAAEGGARVAEAPDLLPACSWALPQLTRRASPSRDAIDALALSADGTRLFTAGGARGTIRCWSATAAWRPEPLWEAANNGHAGGVTALAVALDDRGCFSAGRDGEVRGPSTRVAREPTARTARAPRGPPAQLSCDRSPPAVTPARRRPPPQIRRWSGTGALVDTLRGHGEGGVTCLAAHGETLVSAGDEGKVRTWHAGTGDAGVTLKGDGCRITALRISPDGQRVASGGSDRTVRVFAITGGALAELTGHGGWISALVWAPDCGSLLSGSYDGDVRVWATPAAGAGHFALRALLRAAPGDADGAPRSAAPEDRMVAAIMLEPPAQVLEAQAAGQMADDAMDMDEPLPPAFVASAEEPPQARRVYVGTMDGSVSLWDLRSRRREDCRGAGAGAAVCALTHCADAGGGSAPLCVSAHHDGSLRAWRRVRSRRNNASCGLVEAWAVPGAHADWATQLVPSRVPSALRDGNAAAPMLLFSAGEDGALAAWRVAAPRRWSREAHCAFPDGFRAAVIAFLCTLHRMTAVSGAEDAAAAPRDAPAAPPRLRRGSKSASPASPASPLSPEQCGESSPATRRGRRALLPATAAAGAAGVAPMEVCQASLRLHGATRDALVDLVVSALARQTYPDGQYLPGSLR